MTSPGWPLVHLAAQLLERDDREAVLGDLAEERESSWRGLFDVLGLFFRREARVWQDSRPWIAGLGLALPCGYLLTLVSVSVSCNYQRIINHKVLTGHTPTAHEGYFLFFCHIFLLIAWSWVGGYVVGSMSRRTLWCSASLTILAGAYCLATFCMDAVLPKICYFLFVLPAIVGACQGIRQVRVTPNAATLLALTITILMFTASSNSALWIPNWALIWPAWYLAAATKRPVAIPVHGSL